jgi:hypothetical protein
MRINLSRIMDMASVFQDSAILFAASDLGIFCALAKSADATAADVAGAAAIDVRAATLIMDACVAVGLLPKEGSVYRNTPESGAFLVLGGAGDLSKAIWYMRDV